MRKKCLSLTFALAACGLARAQAPPPPTPLAQLLAEADRNNPGIGAARLAWQAATHAIAPASTLPDPEVSLQQVSVGNPLPFAGYTTRNFAYIGVGVSQALPYPGKLRLRGEIARSDADASRAALEGVRRAVHEQLEEAYAELAYLQATGIILQRDQDLLGRMAQLAEERYATGQIAQSEVLAAQLEQTTTLRDLAMHRQQLDIVQARLRELLGRGAAAAPIAATRLEENKLAARAVPPLLPASDPRLEAQQALVARRHASVELAHKNFLPDFTAQYMYQRTASRF
ncbi:MAG: TolC family protein, partial [Terriglobales bacterium]